MPYTSFQLMKPKVSSMWGESGSVWICEDRVTEQSPEPDLQQCFKVLGTESHNSYQYMESQPEQFSWDLSRTAEAESQDLNLEPESQLLFVKYKLSWFPSMEKITILWKSFQSSRFFIFCKTLS